MAIFEPVSQVAMSTKNCFNFNSLDWSSLLLQLRRTNKRHFVIPSLNSRTKAFFISTLSGGRSSRY